MTAANHNTYEIVRVLLERGECVDVYSEAGQLPLHFASIHQDSRILDAIASRTADINAVTKDEEICTAMHYACHIGRPNHVAVLISHGADPMIVDGRGRNAIEMADESGNSEIADMLRSLER